MTNIEQRTVRFEGQEVFDLFQLPFVIDADFSDVVQTLPNVPPNATRNMQFYDIEQYVTRAKHFCEFTPIGGTDFTPKQVQTYLAGVDKEFCLQDLANTIWMWGTNRGQMFERIDGTLIGRVVTDVMAKQTANDRKALMWWGKKTAADAFQSTADGFWGHWVPYYITAGTLRNITTYANATLHLGDTIELLEAVYRNATEALRDSGEADLIYYVDRGVYEQIWIDYAALVKGSVIGEARLRESSNGGFIYRGIAIKKAPLWATQAKKFFPAAYTGNPNLVMLMHRQTLLHLTDMTTEQYETWYDTSKRVNKALTRYAIGTQIIYPELVSTASNHA